VEIICDSDTIIVPLSSLSLPEHQSNPKESDPSSPSTENIGFIKFDFLNSIQQVNLYLLYEIVMLQLELVPLESTVDVVGIILHIQQGITDVTVKKTKQQTKKRSVIIGDNSFYRFDFTYNIIFFIFLEWKYRYGMIMPQNL
jgi:hypothetical protein